MTKDINVTNSPKKLLEEFSKDLERMPTYHTITKEDKSKKSNEIIETLKIIGINLTPEEFKKILDLLKYKNLYEKGENSFKMCFKRYEELKRYLNIQTPDYYSKLQKLKKRLPTMNSMDELKYEIKIRTEKQKDISKKKKELLEEFSKKLKDNKNNYSEEEQKEIILKFEKIIPLFKTKEFKRILDLSTENPLLGVETLYRFLDIKYSTNLEDKSINKYNEEKLKVLLKELFNINSMNKLTYMSLELKRKILRKENKTTNTYPYLPPPSEI